MEESIGKHQEKEENTYTKMCTKEPEALQQHQNTNIVKNKTPRDKVVIFQHHKHKFLAKFSGFAKQIH